MACGLVVADSKALNCGIYLLYRLDKRNLEFQTGIADDGRFSERRDHGEFVFVQFVERIEQQNQSKDRDHAQQNGRADDPGPLRVVFYGDCFGF